MAIHRVLQILSDTDATDQNLSALELHVGLSHAGIEVRTLALAPGSVGQLAERVPVIAPSRRSLAAYTQLRTEQRWADALILQGAAVAEVAVMVGGALPTAISLWSEPEDWKQRAHISRRMSRSIRNGAQLVVHTAAAYEIAQEVIGSGQPETTGTLQPSQIHMIHIGVGDSSLNSVGRPHAAPMSVSSVAQASAKKRAAKKALGHHESVLTIRQIAPLAIAGRPKRSSHAVVDVQRVASQLGAEFIDSSAGATFEEELLLAATDIVVSTSVAHGPSLELLRSMQAGAVAVTVQADAVRELIVDHVTGLSFEIQKSPQDSLFGVLKEVCDNPQLRERLAAAAAERVNAEYALGQIQAYWQKTLSAALASQG